MVWTRVGLASTLGGGEVGGLLSWQGDGWLVGWIASQRFGQFVGWRTGRSLVGKVGGGLHGLQLLATTVSSSSSSSVRMLKGLLWQVWRWCTSGLFLMTFSSMILCDVVATLGLGAATLGAGGGGAFATLGLVAATLVDIRCVSVRTVSPSGACCPSKMAVKS